MHTLLPTNSTIKPITWLVMACLALAIHAVLLLSYEPTKKDLSVKSTNNKVIEIGLKKLLPPPAPNKPKNNAKSTVKPEVKTAVKTPVKTPIKPKPALKKPINTTPKKLKPQKIASPKPFVQPLANATEQTVENMAEQDTKTEKVTESKAVSSVTQTESLSNSKLSSKGGNPKAKASYEATLVMWLERYKRYPNAAKRRGQEDRVNIQFTIDANGNVLSQKIVKQSSYNSLNRAVETMLKRAAPLPSVPEEIQAGKTQFTFIIPVSFRLN